MTPTEYLGQAGLPVRPLSEALASKGRIIAHLRQPGGEDLACTADLASEIALLKRSQGKPPLFVSYFTSDTPYEALAMELRASLDRFGLPHRIEPIPSRGSWVANTGLKARFIEKVWAESDGPICWVDADAAVLRPPGFLSGNPFDLAIVRRHGWEDLSGFVYLGKSDRVGRLIAEWVRLCADHPNVWDQVLLSLAWFNTAREDAMSTLWLNPGIFRFPRPKVRDLRDRIFYYPFDRKIRPYLDQKQASRALKAFVNASAADRDELGTDDLTDDFKRALSTYDFGYDASVKTIFGLGEDANRTTL